MANRQYDQLAETLEAISAWADDWTPAIIIIDPPTLAQRRRVAEAAVSAMVPVLAWAAVFGRTPPETLAGHVSNEGFPMELLDAPDAPEAPGKDSNGTR